MTFVDGYKWGSVYTEAEDILGALGEPGRLTEEQQEVLAEFKDSGIEFEFDNDYPHSSMYDDPEQLPLIRLGVFGGYPGEAIDDANAQAAKELSTESRGGHIFSYSAWFGGCEAVTLYFDLNVGTVDEAADVISTVEAFDEDPVLDEDLYTQIESERWEEMITEMIAESERERDVAFTTDQLDYIREHSGEMFGWWGEGYYPEDEWETIIDEVLAVEPGSTVQLHQADKLF